MAVSKFLGSILLIIGTSIGGGMLALPIATSGGGFYYSTIAFVFCWLMMTAGALLILEVLQPLPLGSNMVTLAKHYLGRPGEILIWLFYLALLYSLLGAYISGGTDVLKSLLADFRVHVPTHIVSCLYTLSFSLIIFSGIKSVDYVNRGLMFGKLGVYFLLILIISPFVKLQTFSNGHFLKLLPSLSILITSFGFGSIVPSLRDYWQNDIPQLKRIILWGSLTPLICYLLWNFVIMGAVSQTGPWGLNTLLHSDHATSGLGKGLAETTKSAAIFSMFNFFSCICMLTAFLNVSLGLFDFLADGLKLKKTGYQGYSVLFFTFIPPLAIVLVNPGIYIQALNYAGIFCIILLLMFPILMGFRARLTHQTDTLHLLPGKYSFLSTLFIMGLLCMMIPYMINL
jgi:tyrosine-specific transport protein